MSGSRASNLAETIASDFRRRLPLLLVTLSAGILIVLAVTGLCWARRVPFSHVSRDAAEILEAPAHYGALSNLGILIWCSGAAACLFGAAILSRRQAERTGVGFLASLGALTGLLVIDDLFLLHEVVLPQLLGVRQRYVMAGYLLLAAAFLVGHRKRIFQTEYPLLALALGFFSISVMSDGVQTRVDLPLHYGIEDGGKLIGILAWTVYSVRESMRRVLGATDRRKGRAEAVKTAASPGPLWGGAQQPGAVERRRRTESSAY